MLFGGLSFPRGQQSLQCAERTGEIIQGPVGASREPSRRGRVGHRIACMGRLPDYDRDREMTGVLYVEEIRRVRGSVLCICDCQSFRKWFVQVAIARSVNPKWVDEFGFVVVVSVCPRRFSCSHALSRL